MSRSSTAPSRPWKVVSTGVPRAAASRFIVPPAEITRSANAIKRLSVDRVRWEPQLVEPAQPRALLGGAREDHDLRAELP